MAETDAAASWLASIRRHAKFMPDAKAFTFLKDGETQTERLTFGNLNRHAITLGRELGRHLNAGERALLIFSPGLAFIKAFLGCIYAGVVPVPVGLPRRKEGLEKLAAIAADCGARVVLTDTGFRSRGSELSLNVPALRGLDWLSVEVGEPPPVVCDNSTDVDPQAIAFLQYTSGSTGAPKGVAITHGNLLANQEMIRLGFGHDRHTVFASWLPLHHDMGLVGNVLQPLYLGCHCVLMPPTAFVQHPHRWLQAISDYQVTTSGGPNFAYDLCTRRVTDAQMASLNLRSWKVAFNGAEPVRAKTLRLFGEKFSAAGFDPRAALPCYGMAEATLFISAGDAARAPRLVDVSTTALEICRVVHATTDGEVPYTTLVSCGQGQLDQRIEIVEPEALRVCGPDEMGEIWLKGSHLAQGYWGNEDATAKHFGLHLPDSSKDWFFRTGDLGFIHEGELFIAGRLKDLIIVAGRNLHPHDLEEQACLSHPLLQGCPSAAFSLDLNDGEKLVLVIESSIRRITAHQWRTVAASVSRSIANSFDAALHQLVLVKPGGVPRTSSGKTQRRLCRQRYLLQALPLIDITDDAPIAPSAHAA